MLLVAAGIACAPAAVPAQQNTAALAEMATIAGALDSCALFTLYYVAPEALDDTSFVNTTSPWQYIGDLGGPFVIPPSSGRFLASRKNLLTGFNAWTGPYLNYQPGRTQTGSQPYDLGAPLDPWGNPYWFFSPLGLLRGDTGGVTLELYGDQFDRYTLVSLGFDGVMSGDDLFHQFGAPVTAFALSSVRSAGGPAPSPAVRTARATGFAGTAGTDIIVRGINLGATQTGAQVFFGARELTDISAWSSREVTLTLPADLAESNDLVIRRGAASTNALQLTVNPPAPTAAGDWPLYN